MLPNDRVLTSVRREGSFSLDSALPAHINDGVFLTRTLEWLPLVTATAESGTSELRQAAHLTRAHALTIGTVLLVGVVVALHYFRLQDVPPGFFSDEASVAYDAKGIGTDGRDTHGVFMPVCFQSFGTWRASLLIYVTALAFRVFGAGVVQARSVAATFSLLTALFLALLAWQLFRSRWLAVATFLVASVTPWLFTTGRFAFDPVTLPTVLAAFLLLWQVADRSGRWDLGLAAGVVLGLSVYAYISAWLFAPLVCVALVIAELPRPRVKLLAGAAVGATLATLPMMLFFRTHPDALTARYDVLSVWLPGHPLLENLGRVWRVYTSGFSPEYLFQQASWVQGGEFLPILAPLMVVGLVSLWRRRGERFWRLVLLGILFAPIPGALTTDFSHGLRNLEAVPFYLSLAVLGAWTLAPLLARERLLAAGLTGLLAFQSVWFLSDYFTRLPERMSDWQVAGFQQATQDSLRFAHGGRIQVTPDAFAAQSGDPQVLQVEFAFFANEDVRDFRRSGIAAVNAFAGDPVPTPRARSSSPRATSRFRVLGSSKRSGSPTQTTGGDRSQLPPSRSGRASCQSTGSGTPLAGDAQVSSLERCRRQLSAPAQARDPSAPGCPDRRHRRKTLSLRRVDKRGDATIVFAGLTGRLPD